MAVTHHDVKLVLDQECQDIAESVIRSQFPDHDILGEENLGHNLESRSEFLWIIDPIDGTVNFSQGHDMWCCSIAVQRGHDTLAAAVYAPARETIFHAAHGLPAYCNDAAIHVSNVASLENAMIHTGFDRHPGIPEFTIINRLSESVRKTRVLGSAALDLCMLAAGIPDGYFETGIHLWDVAAAGFIVQQAGGISEQLGPTRDHYKMAYIASNGQIHAPLKDLITSNVPSFTD
jgi:myo-inositol-1(or 4)-monophosphatase